MAKNTEIDSTRPSLERLKALDSLPDLASQLQEAKRLCNHSARADMICKWLLEKLKSKTEMRDSPEAWETLLSALRLLSPQRVAILLSSHGFLGLCKTPLEDESNTAKDALFLVLVRVLNYLLDVSAGTQGTQLKAVLCVPASQGASFLNVWIKSALTLVGIVLLEHDLGNDFLRPGIEIWNLRKQSVGENELFARNCLLSTSRLLPILNHYEHPNRLKRKREADQSSQQSYKQMLESILARHVFVPARAAFFNARDATETKAKRQIGSQEPTSVLRSMVEPLREAGPIDEGLDEGQLAVLPQLLDVAIRCTPITTPKQSMREKPWIDAVFQALQECSGQPNSSDEIRQALKDMLSLTKERKAPLSSAVLNGVIEGHSGLGSGKEVDWDLISLVVEISSDVFADNEKAALLFADITRVAGDLDERKILSLWAGESPIQAVEKAEKLLDFLHKQIIAPVMKAFAGQRKLGTFVDMWATQISSERLDGIPLIWIAPEADLAGLLEDSLTQSQILDIFDRYFESIKSAGVFNGPDNDTSHQSVLRASVVILDAIYSSIRSESLTDALHERSGELLECMLGPPAPRTANTVKPSALPMDTQTWLLMTKAFELWFPAWAIAQSDATAVAVKGVKFIRSSGFAVATYRAPDSTTRTARAAQAFIACLCSYLLHYDQHDQQDEFGPLPRRMPRDFLIHRISRFAEPVLDLEHRNVFLRFPWLVSQLFSADKHSSTILIQSFITHCHVEAGHALSTIVLQRGRAEQVDSLVALLLKCILHQELYDDPLDSDEPDYKYHEENEIKACKNLSALSLECLSRPHRESLIDAICEREQAEKDWDSPLAQAAQTWRFAVLVRFMKLPNATSKLAVDADEFWRLIHSVTLDLGDRILPLLGEVSSLLCSHLLATQDQDRSRSMLIDLSRGIKERIESIGVQPQHETLSKHLVVISTLVHQLELGSKESLKLQYVHRERQSIKTLLGTCFNLIVGRISPIDGGVLADNLQVALKLLLNIPESLTQLSATDVSSWHEHISQLMLSRMDYLDGKTNGEPDGSSIPKAHDLLVVCFQLACKMSSGDDTFRLSILAPSIARLRLTASNRHSFMASFQLYVQKLQQSQYIELLNGLLDAMHDESGTKSASVLPLLEACITRPSQTESESGESQLPKLLSKLLTMVTDTRDVLAQKSAIRCVTTALKGNSSLMSQYDIELTLQTMKKVLDVSPMAPVVYLDVCQVLSTILLQYRSRLHGRLHLVVQVFQALTSRLFVPADSIKATHNQRRKPTVKHARAFGKLLTLLCEPPQSKRPSKSSSLVDESRKEQAYVGKSVQYILHHYCRQILTGRLGPGMREAITPGLWSMIEAMEMGEAEGVKSLSAAMNSSERAVLRGVYDDWRRFGKWRGA